MPDLSAGSPSVDRTPARAALELINAGRVDDAAQLLGTFLGEHPADVPALGLLSLAHLRAGRWAAALQMADLAIGLDPGYLPGWQRRSIALIELGRKDDAAAAACEYLRLAPDQWHPHYTMARVLRGVPGRRREALEYAQRAVELAPDEADAHNILGVIHRILQDSDSAEQAYRRALAIDPAHALAMTNLAMLTLGRTGSEEAMAALRAAAASDPQQAAVHQHMVLLAVLKLQRWILWLALSDLLLVWGVLTATHDGMVRLATFGLVVLCWVVTGGWWLFRLGRYLRSLVPGALGRLMRFSDVRWGLGCLAAGAVLSCLALLVPAAATGLVTAGILAPIAGSMVSMRMAARRRRLAATDSG
jgi:Flp pilus assembly protein TadD